MARSNLIAGVLIRTALNVELSTLTLGPAKNITVAEL